jgi:hypothetical protein
MSIAHKTCDLASSLLSLNTRLWVRQNAHFNPTTSNPLITTKLMTNRGFQSSVGKPNLAHAERVCSGRTSDISTPIEASDVQINQPLVALAKRSALPLSFQFLLVAICLAGVSGCSLFVMAGKMFTDMKSDSPLKTSAGVDLAKSGKKLLVVCRTPHLVRGDFPTVEIDLNEGINRRLKRNGIQTISTDDVAKWFDQNGGEFDHPRQLAEDFDCDFIAVVNLRQLSFYEENSPDMFRGNAIGGITVYEVQEVANSKRVSGIFSGEFRTEHPRLNPISTHQISKRVFEKQFVDHMSTQIAKQFHDFRRGSDF